MKRVTVIIFAVLSFAVPCKCQFVTRDEVSPSSGCRSPFTYDNGINLRISVLANTKDSSIELERIMVKDISRFKESGQISSSHDTVPGGQKQPIEFDATIFWTELQVDGKPTAYAAAAFFFETCAIFMQGRGFSTQLLTVDNLAVQPTKEKMLDYLEKRLYDGLVAEVKSRRAAAKILKSQPVARRTESAPARGHHYTPICNETPQHGCYYFRCNEHPTRPAV